MNANPDAATDLNNYLQNHPKGNLTGHFHWDMTREGPDSSVIHTATAMCGYHNLSLRWIFVN
jgi:hypothetical protein